MSKPVWEILDEMNSLESVRAATDPDGPDDGPDWDAIARELQTDCEWSAKGAEALCMLAEQYGAFVLRSALALAIALEIEDGSEGI